MQDAAVFVCVPYSKLWRLFAGSARQVEQQRLHYNIVTLAKSQETHTFTRRHIIQRVAFSMSY